ncbi:MAG: thiamine pyrophosphate-dependent enzyme [Candidatus Methanospirareceae archaeon]
MGYGKVEEEKGRKIKIAIPTEEYLLKGNSSCAGCTAMLALRYILKASGKDTVLLVGACCAVVCEGVYPNTCLKVPTLDTAFACTAAMADGVAAVLKDKNVIAFAGDGGTADIGLQSLSGAIERGANILYVCYDNEAYCNTGMQRSGSTPLCAITTTTPRGKREKKKDIPRIIAAHDIPYMATACPSYPLDLYRKVKKALSIKGPKYMHVLAPCPVSWRFPTEKGIEVGKLAVKTGVWVLYEVENGILRISAPSKKVVEGKVVPVERYLRMQGRFSNLTDTGIERIQKMVYANLERYRSRNNLFFEGI